MTSIDSSKSSLSYILNEENSNVQNQNPWDNTRPFQPVRIEEPQSIPLARKLSSIINPIEQYQHQLPQIPKKRVYSPTSPTKKIPSLEPNAKKQRLSHVDSGQQKAREGTLPTDKALRAKKEFADTILDNNQMMEFIDRYREMYFENLPIDDDKYIAVRGGPLQLLVHCLYNENDLHKIINLRENLEQLKRMQNHLIREFSRSSTIEVKYIKKFLDCLCNQNLDPEKLQIILAKVGNYREAIKGNSFLHLLINKLFTDKRDRRVFCYNNLNKIEQIPEGKALLQKCNEEGKNCLDLFDERFFEILNKLFEKDRTPGLIEKRLFENQCIHAFVFKTTNKESGFVKGDSILHFLIRLLFKFISNEHKFL